MSSGSTIAWITFCLLTAHSCSNDDTKNDFEGRISSLASDVASLQRKAEDARIENDRLSSNLRSSKETLEIVRENSHRLATITGILERDNKALKNSVTNLRRQVTSLNSQVDSLSRDGVGLQ